MMRYPGWSRTGWCCVLLGWGSLVAAADRLPLRTTPGIWTSREELARLPMAGPAWEYLREVADRPLPPPDLSDQNQKHNVLVLARALVFGRTGEPRYRQSVVEECLKAIGTERNGRTLALGRNLVSYVIAADLVGLDPPDRRTFEQWLAEVRHQKLDGRNLISTHEDRPNNWGTHAGASRVAIAIYLQDQEDLARAAAVFKGYLGDRSSYASFTFGSLTWQADPRAPVGVNPRGAVHDGHSIDGALPDDMRRGGNFQWPPLRTDYPWEALQGAAVQAEILHRAGYPAWEWEDQALLRAIQFLYRQGWEPSGDDRWTPWLFNFRYGTTFPAHTPARPGKNMGWTDWTHVPRSGAKH